MKHPLNRWLTIADALIATGVVLVLVGCAGCGKSKLESPERAGKDMPISKEEPLPAASPPTATNTPPMSKSVARTPAELFQDGLKLWNGKGVTKDPVEAVRLFTAAAEQGHVDAQAYLAGAYRTGSGVGKNPDETVRWFRAAAERGDARSQGVLASIYGTGEGVPKDLPEAAKWYRLAAEQGLVRAQANLGAYYFLGQGVPKDPVEAYKWLHLAAQKGDQEAAKNRGLVAQKLSVAQMTEGRKRAADFVPMKAK